MHLRCIATRLVYVHVASEQVQALAKQMRDMFKCTDFASIIELGELSREFLVVILGFKLKFHVRMDAVCKSWEHNFLKPLHSASSRLEG